MKEILIPERINVPLNKLKVDGQNPNRMTKKQHEALAESIIKYGFIKPIITNKDLLIADGEQRLTVARSLGMTEVPVIKLPVSDIDRRLLRQVLNKLKGEHLQDMDAQEFLRIVEAGERETLKKLLTLSDGSIEKYLDLLRDTEDEVPPIKETNIQRGDLYQLGKHRLFCGDATDKNDVSVLMNGKTADMIFTDPPYGMGKAFANDDKSKEELEKWNALWIHVLGTYTKNNVLFLCWHSPRLFYTVLRPALEQDWNFLRMFRMHKPNDITFPWHSWIQKSEVMMLFGRGTPKFNTVHPYTSDTYTWNHPNKWDESQGDAGKDVAHPSIKPRTVVEDLIQRMSGKIIVDIFGGTGTTLIASEKNKRICFMMEIDPQYCQIIIDRWENYTKRRALKID